MSFKKLVDFIRVIKLVGIELFIVFLFYPFNNVPGISSNDPSFISEDIFFHCSEHDHMTLLITFGLLLKPGDLRQLRHLNIHRATNKYLEWRFDYRQSPNSCNSFRPSFVFVSALSSLNCCSSAPANDSVALCKSIRMQEGGSCLVVRVKLMPTVTHRENGQDWKWTDFFQIFTSLNSSQWTFLSILSYCLTNRGLNAYFLTGELSKRT